MGRVLLRPTHEPCEVFLELIEVDALRTASVRGRSWERRGELNTELVHAVLREDANEAIDDAVHHAFDGCVVGALAEHLRDRLNEIARYRLGRFVTALGDVEEAARHTIDADGVNTDTLLDELRRHLRRNRDKR